MATWKKTHLPCPNPDCGSSDGFSIDHEDKGYCFVCEKLMTPEGDPISSSGFDDETPLESSKDNLILGGGHYDIPVRKISKKTCELFDVKIVGDNYVFPYYDSNGSLVGQKCRPIKEKMFFWKGSPKNATLFGQSRLSSGRSITIVEGEFDALAYVELMGEYPVVSIVNGAQGGVKDVKKQLDFFKNFQKVYICLDNDTEGKKAAEKIAELFPIGKAKIVNLSHYKDAGEYLENNAKEQFKRCWWDAVDYTPAGIEAASEGGFESLFEEVDGLELFPYPYDKLNETTFGIRKGEMITVVAGSGVGKSAFIGEVAYKLLSETDKKVGMLMLEESPKKTKLRMMSYYLNKPLHLTLLGRVAEKFDFLKSVLERIFSSGNSWEWTQETRKELKKAWEHVIEKKAHDGENQLWLFSHFGSNDIDTIVNRIDAMVTGLGCEFIFLDHISIVVSEQQNGDERKALDELATKLRTLVERRNFSLIIVSHLRRPGGKPHEEGGETSLADIRGTAGIGQLSDIVIGLERNGQHQNEFLRNITKMRVLKNRFAGITGLTSYASYDISTGRLTEEDPKMIEALESDDSDSKEFLLEDTPVFDSTPTGSQIENERNT